jgi:hypothetical protein
MKQRITGIVHNSRTNPFQTFSRKTTSSRNSALLSFDISFDLCDAEGQLVHVWFNRSFRFPPPLEDGDRVEVIGRHGQLWGLISRKNFYAMKIIDSQRNKEYTTWRNKEIDEGETCVAPQ